MPVKQSTMRATNRDYVMSKKWWKAYQDESGSEIPYETVQIVIESMQKAIAETIVKDPQGFKMPENMGYLVVTKYASKKKIFDPVTSKTLGKTVYFRNMHSLGYLYSIRWYAHRIVANQFSLIYRFLPARSLARAVSKAIKEETDYIQWSSSDFIHHHTSLK